MGAQSFDAAVLASLERIHQPDVGRARRSPPPRRAGYDNVNLDLIYGADGETLDSWERTLRRDDRARARARQRLRADDRAGHAARPRGGRAAPRPAPDPDLQADMFARGVRAPRRGRLPALRGLELGEARASSAATTSGTGSAGRTWAWARARTPTATTTAGGTSARPRSTWTASSAGELPSGGEEHLDPSDAYLEEVFLQLRILEGHPGELGRRTVGPVHRERPARRRVRPAWCPPSAACCC